eukprot:29299-Pelagococcus_subviridis.AAC.1
MCFCACHSPTADGRRRARRSPAQPRERGDAIAQGDDLRHGRRRHRHAHPLPRRAALRGGRRRRRRRRRLRLDLRSAPRRQPREDVRERRTRPHDLDERARRDRERGRVLFRAHDGVRARFPRERGLLAEHAAGGYRPDLYPRRRRGRARRRRLRPRPERGLPARVRQPRRLEEHVAARAVHDVQWRRRRGVRVHAERPGEENEETRRRVVVVVVAAAAARGVALGVHPPAEDVALHGRSARAQRDAPLRERQRPKHVHARQRARPSIARDDRPRERPQRRAVAMRRD